MFVSGKLAQHRLIAVITDSDGAKALLANVTLAWKNLARKKRSSLFCYTTSNKLGQQFYNCFNLIVIFCQNKLEQGSIFRQVETFSSKTADLQTYHNISVNEYQQILDNSDDGTNALAYFTDTSVSLTLGTWIRKKLRMMILGNGDIHTLWH